ncbi:MAG TPA: sigma 54-interacting transcriptional regulator [Thermoanaerobaculaceae bacterium]|nr:sigma 54-interacting transcriptional regulator [Thermoanaerobaculaceae bacterium]
MKVRTPTAGSLARLLAWDAPFLPTVDEVSGDPDAVLVRCSAPGVGVAAVPRWPRGQRAAVALQVLATAAFLLERGWYPSRALLRGGRVERGDDGPWYRLGRLPALRLEDAELERRLRPALGSEETVLVPAVFPILSALLPELAGDFERAVRARPAWEAIGAWLGVLLGSSRRSTALRHPAGLGRALWSRRLAVPESGVAYVDDESVLAGVAAAARLRSLGGPVIVAAGAFEEEEIAQLQARAAARGHDALVLTTIPVPGVSPLPLDGGRDSVWVAAPRPEYAHAYGAAAAEAGERRPRLARAVLEAGAGDGFSAPPRSPAALRERGGLASPNARAVLAWLASSPVGLEGRDLIGIADSPEGTLAELERLGLARQRDGVWRASLGDGARAGGKLDQLAERLPAASVAGLVARAVTRGDTAPLAEWSEERLAAGDAHAVLDVALATASVPALRIAGAEAALRLGRLAEAERLLRATATEQRDGRWHALAAWHAEETSASETAASELAAVGRVIAPRLAARCELVAAHAARRAADRAGQRAHLERAVALAEPPPAEAEIALAVLDGPGAMRALARRRRARWDGNDAARHLHATGLAALDRGCHAGAMTALRAALRSATGDNPHLLGELHADLACAAILAERPGVADRHLALAEGLLERCGSLRAATVVRANRAVLANDRLDWRAGRELTLTGRRLRGEVDDAGTQLFELELARADLARGDVNAVQRQFSGLASGVERFPEHPVLRQALADLRAQLALALGDLPGAAAAAGEAEPAERVLVEALVAADSGSDPSPALPRRWGVAISAHLLAAWRRGDADGARARFESAHRRWPREAAVGLARFVAVLARRAERVGPEWEACEKAAEDTLLESELDGWAHLLRGSAGADPVRLVRALDGVVNSGTDGVCGARLEALARAIGVRWLTVERGGATLAAWGDASPESQELEVGGVTVRSGRDASSAAMAALSLVAKHLAARTDGGGPERETGDAGLLGGGSALRSVREQVALWGPLPLTVLITGEPGTGKELVARALHAASGRRGSFVPVNCAGIPAQLLEAELFGVLRGAFTGADRDRQGLVETAERGTLFLDEIGELPPELQAKLLRLLQEREVRRVGATRARTVDVRFLAATNRDLNAEAAAGRFRWDLYYRVAVAVIEVPPLRDRREDIESLAAHFVSRFATMLDRPGVRLAPAAAEVLRRASWPGNVRELESAVARAVAASRPGEILGPDRFPDLAPRTVVEEPLPSWPTALEAFRRRYFEAVLREEGGNRSRAARRAGVSRQTLLYHLKELRIRDDDAS